MRTIRRGKRFWPMLIAMLIGLTLLGIAPPKCAPSFSNAYAASDSVTFSLKEAQDIAAALDSLTTRSRLLQVDLDECRALALSDSAAAAQKLQEATPSWYEKIYRHPIVWFTLGAFVAHELQR